MRAHRSFFRSRPSLAFVLLVGLLLILCLAGGASRGDVLGQFVVRGTSWFVLIVGLLAGAGPLRPKQGAVPVLLVFVLALSLVQLVPIPPGLWLALPGHAIFTDAAVASGQAQSWRPWSIVPGATVNAISSLVVPFAVWFLVANVPEGERRWLPGVLLGIITISAFVGLLQFSGAVINNPFVNDAPGEVSGTFANRNHFALLLASGCLLAPVWGFLDQRESQWRAPIAWGLLLLFLLMILATGSRAGLVLGVMALLIGLLLVRRAIRRMFNRYPGWVFPTAIVGIVGVIAIFVTFSVLADRAVSINRMFAADQGQDMRGRGLPVVLEMIGEYFPVGSGFGGFDPLFRLHEPLKLLKPTYFNHAHNDFLEVALDAGLPGILLLFAALGWWVLASMRAWHGASEHLALARLGSAILFLVILASILDYPARTPMIMAIMVIAAVWLSGDAQEADRSTLPGLA